MTENIKIWEKILPELVKKIKEAENDSYSINLLEEVKMANKFVRETNKDEKKGVSLRVNVDENANSRILAKLLQYKSPDGEYEILQSLLDYISNRDENAVQNFGDIKIDNDNTIITTEETLNQETLNQETQNKDNGRIDILVRTRDYAIIFENKLFNAPDQEYQLAKYIIKVIKANGANFKDKNIFVIYLSRDGNEPAEDSWKNPDHNAEPKSYSDPFASRYANISFREDIRCWLKDCVLPNVRKKDTDLESALVQYINYLKLEFMMNNNDLTKWLEDKLKNIQQWKDSNETGRLEIVGGLIDYLSEEGEKGPKKRKFSVQQLRELIKKTNDKTNEDPLGETDLLNKVIAVIKNLRDNCRDKVLEPFYHVSKDYFGEDEIRPSYPSAAYCRLFKEKWEGEIRFIWLPFFFNAEKNEYKLALEIILSKEAKKNKNRITKFNTVQDAIKTVQDAIKNKQINVPNIEGVTISYEFPNNNSIYVSGEKEQASPRVQRLLQITLETNDKLLNFAPEVQETLFRAIYGSLSGVIEAIDDIYSQNPALKRK